jgi:phosphoribosylformylglycinamidine synthase subunit PurQ / glutaminase
MTTVQAPGSTLKVGVVTFPGSNCDHDCYRASKHVLGAETVFLWHKEHDLAGCDVIILPGGFSYGDHLRAGAIARVSPIMREVAEFAQEGGIVAGICNGFQILCEAGLLPGALIRNRTLRFISKPTRIRVERSVVPFTSEYREGDILTVPVAHGEGCYVAPEPVLDELEAEGRVLFRYVDEHGESTDEANRNGSARNIAGIMNDRGNVLGMMPHPERAVEGILGSEDGAGVFRSIAAALESSGRA